MSSQVGEEYHPECLVYTAKHGSGKLQVWRCMGAGGVGTLKVVNGQLNAKRYVRLICRTLLKDGKKLCGRDFVFQQDGAPCYQPCLGLRETESQAAHGHHRVLS